MKTSLRNLARSTTLKDLSFGAFIFLLGITSIEGQTCTPMPTITPCPSCTPFNYGPCTGGIYDDVDANNPNPDPALLPIPTPFQPPDGSKLKWRKYIPSGTGPFPTVLVVHGQGFHGGSPMDAGVEQVSRDLQARGYLALAVTYRLAPCGLIEGQPPHDTHPESGRPSEQTDDIKSLVKAARSLTSLCNGKVGIIGGSAGGSHAAFLGLDKTASPPNTYPNWCQNGNDDRPLCTICLSGAYDMADRTDTGPNLRQQYIRDVESYTNTVVPNDQRNVSPVAKVRPISQQSFMPMYLVNSDGDIMPPHQIEDMRNALCVVGIDEDDGLKLLTILNNSDHSWNLWDERIAPDSQRRVRDETLDFLAAHLN
jgi:acetyl esterase/lipase